MTIATSAAAAWIARGVGTRPAADFAAYGPTAPAMSGAKWNVLAGVRHDRPTQMRLTSSDAPAAITRGLGLGLRMGREPWIGPEASQR